MHEVITQVLVWDDLDHARDGTRTPAAASVTVGLDGAWRELDLSEEHQAELRDFLAPWLKAGRAPEKAPAPKPAKPPKKVPTASAMEYGRGIRAFAQEYGFKYQTSTGNFYYSNALRKAYDEYLAKHREGDELDG